MIPPSRSQSHRRRWLPALVVAIALHLVIGWLFDEILPHYPVPKRAPVPVSLVVLPPSEEEVAPPVERETPELDGQLVEIAKPKTPQRPDDSDYLAEYDQRVVEETRTEETRVNPEVVAPEYSEQDKMEIEEHVDLNVTDPSTGATVGNERFDPARDGTLASLPSRWTVTNKAGLQDPVPSSHESSEIAGAPQNDLLREKLGDRVALNTREMAFAGYLLRIRRLVNFYWDQNLRNLPRSLRIAKPQYTTVVEAVLDGNGALESLEITTASGSTELDDCIVRAYQLAGPFPNPPEQLISADGRVHLPTMSWTVTFTAARNEFHAVDPNQGVQFPGILKAPR